MPEIELTDFEAMLRGNAGLIIGPGSTVHPGFMEALSQHLGSQFGVTATAPTNYLQIAEAAIAKGSAQNDVRQSIRDFVSKATPAPSLRMLTSLNWSAVFSTSIDLFFENKLQQQSDRILSRRAPSVITDFNAPLHPRTVPVYKLLGVSTRDDQPVTYTDYLSHRATWRRAIPNFNDSVRGNPVFCCGLSDTDWAFLDWLVELIGERKGTPSDIFTLGDDPLATNSRIPAILKSRSRVFVVRASMTELLRVLDNAAKKGFAPTFPSLGNDSRTLSATLQKYSDIATLVNDHVESTVKADERLLLLDMLFSPTMSRWEPYAHNLDFRRTLSLKIFGELRDATAEPTVEELVCVVSSGAASGKTTILKRLAYDLAKAGQTVVWQRPCFIPNPKRQVRLMFDEIARSLPKGVDPTVHYFIDDPFATGTLTPELLRAVARDAGVRLILTLSFRGADRNTESAKSMLAGFSSRLEYQLEDSLDDDEWKRFPGYLVQLGIFNQESVAVSRCNAITIRDARDTLSLLYFLLPQTRQSIASSVREQLFRLGDPASLKQIVMGATEHTTQLLHDAYRLVAVSNFHGASCPIEVLVASLNVSYSDWSNATKPNGPAWGILYLDAASDDVALYRTRNAIVTETIVEIINGGQLSHSGEFQLLKRLVTASEGHSNPVYREFVVGLLVGNEKLSEFEYADGLDLFQTAIKSLPFPDKTLVHHMGLWILDRGDDPIAAAKILEEALTTPVYPYTERGEADQHIYASLANAKVRAMDKGLLTLQDATPQIADHLEKARSSDFFNANAVHIQARVTLRMIPKFSKDQATDLFATVSKSLADIEVALLAVKNPMSAHARHVDNIQRLEDIRSRLFAAASGYGNLETEALSVWEKYGSQEGFTVAARNFLDRAAKSNRGGDFKKAYDYVERVRAILQKADRVLSRGLAEVQLQTYWYWNVERSIVSPTQNTRIDWELLKSLATEALTGTENKPNPFYRFMLAVSEAHLNRWDLAESQFNDLRQRITSGELWVPRSLLLNDDGGPKRLEGTIRVGAGRSFFYVEDIHQDFTCDRRGNWPRDGEKTHAYIQFAFAGPRAIDSL